MEENWIQHISKDSKFANRSYTVLSELFDALEDCMGPIFIELRHPAQIAYAKAEESPFDAASYKYVLTERRDLQIALGVQSTSLAAQTSSKDFTQKLKKTINPSADDDEPLTNAQIEKIVERAQQEWDSYISDLAQSLNQSNSFEYQREGEATLFHLTELGLITENSEYCQYSITAAGIALFKCHAEKNWQDTSSLFGLDARFPILMASAALLAREVRGNFIYEALKFGAGSIATAAGTGS